MKCIAIDQLPKNVRYTITVRNVPEQDFFQPYEGIMEEEARRVFNACVWSLKIGRGTADVVLDAGNERIMVSLEEGLVAQLSEVEAIRR